jgi:16S rRNA (adenine1518-N6/adenine1519-N6)-dimethyltransferase
MTLPSWLFGAEHAGLSRNPPTLKKYGQHFLSDQRILDGIVDALAPTDADTVVEVGPGRGSLTDILVGRGGRVIGVEIDRALAQQLREKYRSRANVEIVQADVLETDLHELAGEDFLLIGNVPYYITTPIVFKALEPPMPRRSVFLVQREVADRMAATADTEAYGALSVNVAVVAITDQVMSVPRAAFKPPPKVDSTVIRLTPRVEPLVALETLAAFRSFVQAAFGLRRKQMQRVLRTIRGLPAADAGAVLEKAGIESAARPEVLSPADFVRLFKVLQIAQQSTAADSA